MNSDIQEFIKSYRTMIDMYRPKVTPDSARLKDTDACLGRMTALGESCGDIGEFMTKVSQNDMMNQMSSLISELASESINTQQTSGAPMKIPSSAEAALGYHKAFEAMADRDRMPQTTRVYERVFEIENQSKNAAEFVRKMAEEKLFAKMSTAALAEKFQNLPAQADSLSQPVMAYHNEQMIAMANRAQSAIEIEYESQRLVELNRMELVCDQLLVNDLYITLGNSVTSWMLTRNEEDRQRVENSCRFVAEFFGVPTDEIFNIERISDYIKRIILPALNQKGENISFESFIKDHKDVIAACLKGKPPVEIGPSSRKYINLWDKTIPLADALKAFRNPVRPGHLNS